MIEENLTRGIFERLDKLDTSELAMIMCVAAVVVASRYPDPEVTPATVLVEAAETAPGKDYWDEKLAARKQAASE